MRATFLLAATLAILNAPAALAQPATPVDYRQPASWFCRPGQETLCTTDLDAVVVRGDGQRTRQAFTPAVDPPIDCFYVYPTVSNEPRTYADLTPSPELQATVRNQAGRLSAKCRMFAPIYRQLTLQGLRQEMAAQTAPDWSAPYADVRAAWNDYLAHDNHGRGVVLVGHSQGTILLQKLIAEEIDGKPVQKQLVSAFLAGDPSLPVPLGARVGGVFKSVPLCSAASQTGCVYVWGSYLAGATEVKRLFGASPGHGLVGGCESPAAPGGGSGPLKAYLPRPADAPVGDPPYVEVIEQLSGACEADAQGDVQRITVVPSRYSARLEASFGKLSSKVVDGWSWGLHHLDLDLVQGNILDVVDAETRTWSQNRPLS